MASDIGTWLARHGFEAYAPAFEQNDIDLDLAAALTDDDLKSLGVVSLGHRKKLLRAITALRLPAPEGSEDVQTLSAGAGAASDVASPERRQLTVMFCDLVDSTALSARVDPEDYRDTIRNFQDACAAVVGRYAGYIARYMGDGVLAYFGWPHSSEDDAERAVRAGLGIVDAVAALPHKAEEPALKVRIGLATGATIVGDIIGQGAAQEAAATGVTPNLAARLQQVAPANAVVVSDATRELLRDLFQYESLGSHTLKGIDRPVEVWRVVGTGHASSRFEAVHGKTLTPLVGRDHELALLRDRWQRARSGEGHVAMLIGEAGIGKSRLAEAMLEEIDTATVAVTRYQCSPYEATSAFSPIIRQLEQSAGLLPDDDSRDRSLKLTTLLEGTPAGDAALIASLLMPPQAGGPASRSLSPQQTKQRTLDALCRHALASAARKPVLLIFEDAHWIDPSSLELLELIVSRTASLRAMVVVTQRPEWSAPFLAQPHVTQLHLGRLGREQVGQVVRSVAKADIPVVVLDRIVARTDGIPLFAEEVTRAVVESGFDFRAEATTVPDTLQASLMARLDRLPAPAKAVAQVAAAIGREVAVPLLRNVVEQSPGELDALLRLLIGSQLLVQGSEEQVVFRHALIRDVAYQSLIGSRRRGIHRSIAKAIEDTLPQVVESQPELVARHHAEAGNPRGAIEYWRRAGMRATTLLASREAVEHYRNALGQLALLPASPERDREELQLVLAMGVPLIASTGYGSDEVRETYSRARQLSELVGDRDCLFSSTRGLWNCVYDQADLDYALELARSLVELAGPDRTKQALAQRALGSTQMNLVAFDEAVVAFDRCIAAQKGPVAAATSLSEAEAPAIVAHQYKGFIRCLQGRPAEGLQLHSMAVAQARELRHPLLLAFALHVQSAAASLVRRYELAHQLATETFELATEHGLVFWIAGSKITQGCASVHLYRNASDLQRALQGLQEWRSTSAKLYVPMWSALIADAALVIEDTQTAIALVADASAVADANRDFIALAHLQRLQGDLALRKGDTAGAKDKLELAMATAGRQGAVLFGAQAALSLARLLLALGDKKAASRCLDTVLETYKSEEGFPDLDEARTLRGQAA